MEELMRELIDTIKGKGEDELLSRADVMKKYNLSRGAVDKLFHSKDVPIVDLGTKADRISKKTLEELFRQGIRL